MDFDLLQQLQKHCSLSTEQEGSLPEEGQRGPSKPKFKRTESDHFLGKVNKFSVLMGHSFYSRDFYLAENVI